MQKTVLVTGGSSGIGADSVRALVENGFAVVTTVRKQSDQLLLQQLYQGKVQVIEIDLMQLSEIEKLPAILKSRFGILQLDGLINNAGVALAAPFVNQSFSEVQDIVQLNLLAVLKLTQVMIPIMKKGSRIINISSVAGKTAAPFLAVYAASKHAIEGFSEALRKELMLLEIKVILVAPGSIKTPIWEKGFQLVKNSYTQSEFAKSFELFIKFAQSEARNALDVRAVSSVIVQAMQAENPRVRYAPVPRKFKNWYLPKFIPVKLYDYLTAKSLRLLPASPKNGDCQKL